MHIYKTEYALDSYAICYFSHFLQPRCLCLKNKHPDVSVWQVYIYAGLTILNKNITSHFMDNPPFW